MEDLSKKIQLIDEQIAALAKQKSDLLEQTRGADLDVCKRLIKQHGFTKSELGFLGKAGVTKTKGASTVGKPPKYANPNDKTDTWSGHGRKPGWFVDALANSIKEDELRIKAD